MKKQVRCPASVAAFWTVCMLLICSGSFDADSRLKEMDKYDPAPESLNGMS